MKVAVCVALCVFALTGDANGYSFMPDFLDSENLSDELYETIPRQDILRSRRRQDPVTDEQYWSIQEPDARSGDVMVSNVDDELGEIVDLKKLPPNYHNTTTITKKIGNQTITINVKIDKTTNPKTGATSTSIIQSSNFGGVAAKECTSESSCKEDMYCRHMLYGNFCSKCSGLGETCSSDAQCCGKGTSGALCVGRVCKTGYKKGQSGTLCKTTKDCDHGLCCARKFLDPLAQCKLLGKRGERCSRGDSDFNLIMEGGLCPCEQGLVCSSNSWTTSIFGGSMGSIFGDDVCSARVRKQPGNWLDGILRGRNFDDPDLFEP